MVMAHSRAVPAGPLVWRPRNRVARRQSFAPARVELSGEASGRRAADGAGECARPFGPITQGMTVSKTNRRQFLRHVRAFLAFSAAGSPGILLFSTPAKVFVAVALAVTAALQVISTFVQRPSGLAAMMSALNAKLDLVLEQLNQIETALSVIAKAIADLEEKLPEMLSNAFTEDKVRRVRAAAQDWFDEKIATREDLQKLDETRRGVVTNIISRIDDIAYDLATNQEGAIPRAAIASPLILGVHMNVLSLAEPSKVGAALKRHLTWHENILSPSVKDSVAYQLADLSAQRDRVLDEISKSSLAKDSGFDRKQWKSAGAGIVTGCAREHQDAVPPSHAWDGRRMDYPGSPEENGKTATVDYVWRLVELTSSGYPVVGIQKSLAAKAPDWAGKVVAPACTPRNVGFGANLEAEAKRHTAITSVDAKMELFLGNPKKGISGLLPQLNSLNGRIAFLEQVIEIVGATRREALRMKMEFPT
jgi:hypothetical protein